MINKIVFNLISQRRESEPGTDLLSMLMQARYEDGTAMSDQQLRDEVVTLLLAGHDTSTLVIAWAWYLLVQHPGVEAKLLDELGAVLQGRAPTFADLPALRYTEMVAKEVMRLYPPVWGFGREVVEACEIGGYRIPKGGTVFISEWVTHRHPGYFPDPETFNPDRWQSEPAKQLPTYAYFPFGGGPRLCIGNAYASIENVLLLAAIAQKFRMSLASDHPILPKPELTLQPASGIRMVLADR